MSSTLTNILPETRRVSAAQRLLKPKTNAIPLLQSEAASYYSYAHTVQLLAYYYFRASALVADPLATLLQDLVPVAITQCLFCAICLPSVGNWNSGTNAGEMIKGSASPGGAKGQKLGAGIPKRKLGAPSPAKTGGKMSAAADISKDAGSSWPTRILVRPLPIQLFCLLMKPYSRQSLP